MKTSTIFFRQKSQGGGRNGMNYYSFLFNLSRRKKVNLPGKAKSFQTKLALRF